VWLRVPLVRGGARAGGRAQRAAGCRRRTNCLRPIRRFVKNFRVRMVGAAMVLRKPLRAVRTASSDDADDADGDRERIEIAPSSLNLLLRL
jgi:hypothetical protein